MKCFNCGNTMMITDYKRLDILREFIVFTCTVCRSISSQIIEATFTK
jgi:hypothetical protein